MPDIAPKTETRRLPVTLTEEDNAVLISLKQHLERKSNSNLSIADVVRFAIKSAAKSEGV